jgi:hypothetical protein
MPRIQNDATGVYRSVSRYAGSVIYPSGLGSNIGHGLFVGWVEHLNFFCWVSFLYPTYLPGIFVLSAKPNKMAEDRIIPIFLDIFVKKIKKSLDMDATLW